MRGWVSTYHIDGVGDHLDNKGVLKPGTRKVRGSVVEDEIDTTQLLQCLKQTTSKQTFADRALEAVHVAGFAQRHLKLMVGTDFSEFLDQAGVVSGETTKLGKCLDGLFVIALADVETRSLGQK